MTDNKTFFAPQLFIPSGITDISFYFKAFGAVEIRPWRNDDGSIHVAELAINGTIFTCMKNDQRRDKLSQIK